MNIHIINSYFAFYYRFPEMSASSISLQFVYIFAKFQSNTPVCNLIADKWLYDLEVFDKPVYSSMYQITKRRGRRSGTCSPCRLLLRPVNMFIQMTQAHKLCIPRKLKAHGIFSCFSWQPPAFTSQSYYIPMERVYFRGNSFLTSYKYVFGKYLKLNTVREWQFNI